MKVPEVICQLAFLQRIPTMNPIPIAIIGAGGISRAHTNGLPFLKDRFRLVGVCDTNEQAAQTLAQECGPGIPHFTDYFTLLDKTAPHAVIITLPHFLHHPIGLDCLARKIHVLIEKPITCSAKELKEIDAKAKEMDLIVMAGQMRRFGSSVQKVHDWVQSSPENFGQLRSFDIVVQVNIDAYTGGRADHWILDGVKSGGGVVTGFGIHRVDLIRHLGGCDFSEVTALGRFDEPFVNGAESQANALFSMSNGATGTLHANGLAPRTGYMDSFTLHGTHGSIMEVNGPLRYATKTGAVTHAWNDQHQGWVEATESLNPQDNPFVRQLVAFADAIEQGTAPIMNSIKENFNTIACMDAIAESLRSGRTVTVEKWSA